MYVKLYFGPRFILSPSTACIILLVQSPNIVSQEKPYSQQYFFFRKKILLYYQKKFRSTIFFLNLTKVALYMYIKNRKITHKQGS